MAKNLRQINAEIARLQKEAKALRNREIGEVVSKIKKAIKHYALTPSDLFGRAVAANGKAAAKAARKSGKKPGVIRFRDEAGNTWTGRGKRPNWFKDALAAGKKPEDLAAK